MDDMKIILECRNETVAELVDLIGVENTVIVVKYFNGNQVYIPKFRKLAKEYRDSEIYGDYKNGIGYKVLSAKYKLKENTVRNIVAVRKKNEQS
ncbi:MAG: hypothetical protein K2J32_04910 [Ruminococcus sp.]|nr:hypothetical protein [Ruminococcus sp.]